MPKYCCIIGVWPDKSCFAICAVSPVSGKVTAPRRVTGRKRGRIANPWVRLYWWGALAKLLNVSRPHLVKLLEEGAIPFSRVGTHRRIRFQDVMEYRAARTAESEAALQALADQAQEHDMGY